MVLKEEEKKEVMEKGRIGALPSSIDAGSSGKLWYYDPGRWHKGKGAGHPQSWDSHIIIPRRNEKDLKELPRKGVKISKPMFDYQLHGLAMGDRKNVSGRGVREYLMV